MNLKNQKKLAAKLCKTSTKHIKLDAERLADIKESITKADIKGLISDGAIMIKPKKGISKGRTRKAKIQKRKGRRKGAGSRKGKQTARLSKKEDWKNRIRKLREFILRLSKKGKIDTTTKQNLYRKAGGGFFRNLRHMKTYIEEHKLMKQK